MVTVTVARERKGVHLTPDSERGREERGREEANGDATSGRGHDEQVDNGQGDGEDEETRDDGRRDEEDGGEGRGSATVDGGDNDEEGEGTTTRTEDEDINWDDAAEGIGEGIEGPEGFRDSDDDDEGRGGDGGATRRRDEIANGPSREGDGGARGNNGDATDDASRGTDDGGDGEGDSDVEVDAAVSRAPPKSRRTAMEVTANGGRTARYEKAGRGGWRKKCREGHGGGKGWEDKKRARRMSHGCDDGRQRRRRAAARELLRAELAPQGHNDFANALVAERDAVAYEFGANLLDILGGGQIQLAHGSEERLVDSRRNRLALLRPSGALEDPRRMA
mmetsp:Transcript_20143/g.64210  ORF Transcript_20143/g.64210 Transcript_20143/m.64210 type:complete len:335 (-) Transcript_20143:550-1554(-)